MDYWVRSVGDGGTYEIWISDDNGSSWYEIQSQNDLSHLFSHQVIDLAEAASLEGLTLDHQFQIRFTYDGYYGGAAGDGVAIDDIRVSSTGPQGTSGGGIYMPIVRRSLQSTN